MQLRLHHAVWLALGTAVISGASVFVNKYAVAVVPNATAYALLKNGLVALFLVGAVALFTRFRELRTLRRADWVRLVAIGVVGGSIPFVLFFTGLTMTSATSAGLIHKTLFLWVALLAGPFLRERIHPLVGIAFVLLIAGNAMLGGLEQFSFGRGELFILGATILWAIENVIAKKALAHLSSVLVACARMAFGAVILFFIVAAQGNVHLLSGLSAVQWGWALVTVVFLFGYVVTWYAALKHAPATLVASLLVPASLITNILSFVFGNQRLSSVQVAAGGLFFIAVALLVWKSRSFISHHVSAPESNRA